MTTLSKITQGIGTIFRPFSYRPYDEIKPYHEYRLDDNLLYAITKTIKRG